MSSFVHQTGKRWLLPFATLALLCVPSWLRADTTITTASLANLQTALTTGGRIILAFDNTITTTSVLQIATGTILDASGHNVTISGGNSTRIFNVKPGVNFTNIGMTISAGRVKGTNGLDGANGASGGSIGGNGGNGGPGENAVGAGVLNQGNSTFIGCLFVTNSVVGGNGGNGGGGGNGSFQAGNGGNGGNGGLALGAGIYNLGTLLLSNCTFAGNAATGGDGGVGGTNGADVFGLPGNGGVGALAGGAGVFNVGVMNVTNCTFNQNSALGGNTQPAGGPLKNSSDGPDGRPGGAAQGAAIFNTGTNRLLNSTFYSNVVTGGDGGTGGNTTGGFGSGGTGGSGGGAAAGSIYSAGLTTLKNCTFANDNANGGNGGAGGTGVFNGAAGVTGGIFGASIANGSGSFTLKNSILAYTTNGTLAFGTITDSGNNISSDATPAFATTNSHNTLDPRLVLPVAANGGPTLTIALKTNSPAIDKIFDASAPAFDQRGFARPIGVRSDIGAFEFGSAVTNFSVSGRVLLGSNAFAGVTIAAGTGSVPTQTDSNGNFQFLLAGGSSYIVAPQPNGFFNPSSSNIVALSNNVSGLTFTATNATARIALGSSNGPVIQLAIPAIATGGTYRIQASTNLTFSNWVTIATNTTASNDAVVFIQPTTNFPIRFYRTVVP